MFLSNHYPVHDPDWIAETHAQHYLQSWSKQGNRPRVIVGGKGSWFWDNEGKHYLDFQSQLVNANLGHQHPGIIEAIKAQADKLCYIGPAFGSDVRSGTGGPDGGYHPVQLDQHIFYNWRCGCQ